MRVFSQPLLAILFGGFILCAETCLHLEGDTELFTVDRPPNSRLDGGRLPRGQWHDRPS